MSYQRQWYAPMGAAPGQTPTNAEKAAAAAAIAAVTSEEVRAWQLAHGLPADGIKGPATTAAMEAELIAKKRKTSALIIGGAIVGGIALIAVAVRSRR